MSVPVPTSTRMCCSYCKLSGHTIRTCHHPTISMAIELIRNRYNYYQHNRVGSPIARALFINYLHYTFNILQIRAVVVRLRIGNASISKTMGIDCIYTHFTHQRNFTNLVLEPEEEPLLAWSIDRTTNVIPTPSYSLLTNPIQTRVSLHSANGIMQGLQPYLEMQLEQDLDENGYTLTDRYFYHLNAFVNNNTVETRPIIPSVKKVQLKLVSSRNKNDSINEFDCPICLDCVDTKNSIKLNCSHVFCSTCIIQTLNINRGNINCALCRENVSAFDVTSNEVYELMKNNDCIEVA